MTDKDRMDVVNDCYKEMKRLKNPTAYTTPTKEYKRVISPGAKKKG